MHTSERTSRSHSAHEVRDCTVCVTPDLGSRTQHVRVDIVLIIKLIQNKSSIRVEFK